jgi:hypothetical protein
MNMNFLVTFVGKDLKYFKQLEDRFLADYHDLDVEFSILEDLEVQGAKASFLKLYNTKPKIIYIDFSSDESEAFSLSKFLNKNNETRLISTVGLFPYRNHFDLIKKALNVEVRLCYFKSLEIHDVVSHPVSLLNVNLASKREFTSCHEFKDIEILQPIRIGFIEDNHFHIETNSYLNLGEIIELNTHPLIHIMSSTKAFVSKFYEQDLYYNKRFAYDLEFIYIDNDYFTATNERWLLYKDLKKHPEKMEELDTHTHADLMNDMDKRKRSYRPIRNQIDLWLDTYSNESVPKKLKILVIDHQLEIMKNADRKIEDFPYSLNVQASLTTDMYQLQRTMPHLIAYYFDEAFNNEQVLKKLIAKVNSIDEYRPYILVFGHENKELAKSYPDNKVLVYSGQVSLSEIRNIAKILDDKLHITNAEQKVFPSSHSEISFMLVKLNVSVKAMTESIAYFESSLEIPMWTVFLVNNPLPMLLTVVPHQEDSEYKSNPKIYRALINGIGMSEKAKLRQLINRAISEEEK